MLCSQNDLLINLSLSNHSQVAYLTHGSPTINSSTTSYFTSSRSILIARDSTTKLMLDKSSIFLESCQVLYDQNSTLRIILWFLKSRLQIPTLSISTTLPLREGYYRTPLPRFHPIILIVNGSHRDLQIIPWKIQQKGKWESKQLIHSSYQTSKKG